MGIRLCAVTIGVILFTLLALPVPPAAGRQARPEEVRRVTALLKAHREAPGLEEWQKVGPAANRILVDLANNTELDRVVRLRALASLVWFPSRRSEAVLRGRLFDRRYDAHEKSVAMLAYGRAFGAGATSELREMLQETDPELRSGAIRGLALTADPRAAEVLRHHLSHETVDDLRRLTEESLARLARAGVTPPDDI